VNICDTTEFFYENDILRIAIKNYKFSQKYRLSAIMKKAIILSTQKYSPSPFLLVRQIPFEKLEGGEGRGGQPAVVLQ
jgi:hypothetical protein